MDTRRIPSRIPQELHRYFWDVKADALDPAKHPQYVINRLLDKGSLDAARWVVRNFPRETIIETLKTMRDFSPWNGVFWSRYFNVPREEVRCLHPSYLAMRKQLWPY